MDKNITNNKKDKRTELQHKLRNDWKTMSEKERTDIVREYLRINGVDPNDLKSDIA